MAQTQTHTYGHGDSLTNSAQWGRVGEKKVGENNLIGNTPPLMNVPMYASLWQVRIKTCCKEMKFYVSLYRAPIGYNISDDRSDVTDSFSCEHSGVESNLNYTMIQLHFAISLHLLANQLNNIIFQSDIKIKTFRPPLLF